MALSAIQPADQSLAEQLDSQAPVGRGFDSLLTKASQAAAHAGRAKDQKLRHASEQLVADALIQPVLKQMRDSPFRVKMFQGGQAAKAFEQQLDMILSDRIVHSARFPIVNAVYKSLSKRGAAQDKAALSGSLRTHG